MNREESPNHRLWCIPDIWTWTVWSPSYSSLTGSHVWISQLGNHGRDVWLSFCTSLLFFHEAIEMGSPTLYTRFICVLWQLKMVQGHHSRQPFELDLLRYWLLSMQIRGPSLVHGGCFTWRIMWKLAFKPGRRLCSVRSCHELLEKALSRNDRNYPPERYRCNRWCNVSAQQHFLRRERAFC